MGNTSVVGHVCGANVAGKQTVEGVDVVEAGPRRRNVIGKQMSAVMLVRTT